MTATIAGNGIKIVQVDSLEDLHARRLEWLETMLQGGSAIAIPAALQYCSKYDLLAPAWLVKPAAAYCAELFCNGTLPKNEVDPQT